MNKKKRFGIVDIDLLDNGTRHPNLALMKIAGYLKDKNISYELIFDDNVEINTFDYIYASKVFTFSKEPSFFKDFKNTEHLFKGGTGYYAEEDDIFLFNQLRDNDMTRLENDPLLPNFSMAHQMPDYYLYDQYIKNEINKGKKESHYKDYKFFSIGFLTRGCIRKCPFCINKNINYVLNYSKLEDFVDNNRSKIYLWDDNFLASNNWKELLQQLIDTNKSFQFRQGLDIRLITEEKAEMLSKSRYYGDFIFAFDRWKDREMIEKKLSIWMKYAKHKTTKFYLFCGYKISDDNSIIQDVIILFKRIEILMRYGCLGYVMRHENHKNHPLFNIYTQIARWCNQPQFYKKMSFKEFIYRNQYWTKTDRECMSLRTYNKFLSYFDPYKDELEYYFNLKYEELNKTIFDSGR